MSQFTGPKILGVLESTMRHLDISYTPEVLDKLALYVDEIVHWNKRINLTGALDRLAFVRGPLFDALSLIPVLKRTGTLVDIGSGGGLPGIPAAIISPKLEVTLVEPRGRRATFLRHAIWRLGLGAKILNVRDDEIDSGNWQAAVAQAVWPPKEWLKRAPRLLGPEGHVYLLSSQRIDDTDFPVGLILEQIYQTRRPLDDAPRFSARIRRI
jgi:16S rRNA (guanine527-N7)-methyltransferase